MKKYLFKQYDRLGKQIRFIDNMQIYLFTYRVNLNSI